MVVVLAFEEDSIIFVVEDDADEDKVPGATFPVSLLDNKFVAEAVELFFVLWLPEEEA